MDLTLDAVRLAGGLPTARIGPAPSASSGGVPSARVHRRGGRARAAATLEGRTALLTGASGGLGPAIAGELARAGARVAAAGRDEAALARLCDELRGGGAQAAALRADLRDRGAARPLLEAARAELGPVDVLVNNAAVEVAAAFERTSGAEIDEMVRVNLSAPLELTREAIAGMLERGTVGHVVLVSSLSGYAGTAYEAVYAATKGALIAFGLSLRAEYAGRGIGVSVVAPGPVADRGMFARGQRDGIRPPAALRLTTPDDVARAVVGAIRTDAPQVLVAGGPVRPSLALGVLAPRTSERIARRLRLDRLFQPAAEARGRA